ncbi:serine protease [Embleya sp. NPDC008237]|uniref:S1 family peptidase n=1 Tax=Embleya sp. NPDC008237 TaxID=3363978 RepID=UPI0036E68C33
MAGLDLARVVQVCSEGGRASGYVVRPGVVLTAEHAVTVPGPIRVVRFGPDLSSWEQTAQTVLTSANADLAILLLDEESEVNGDCVRYARVERKVAGKIRCDAVGFPLFMLKATTGGRSSRDSHHLRGTVEPGSGLRTGDLTIATAVPPPDPDPAESPWAGMSGSAVFVDGHLIGLIKEHHRSQGPRLTLTTVSSWYARLTPEELTLACEHLELPVSAGDLPVLPQAQSTPTQGLRSVASRRRNSFVRRRARALKAAVGVATLAIALGGTPDGPPSGKAPQGTGKIENLGFTAAISDKSYRVILPLHNPQNKEQRLDKVELIVTYNGPACAEVPFILVYGVQEPVTVDSSGKIKQASVSVDSGLARGFTTPASGEINRGCGPNQLQFRFQPPGAILARQSTTPILVDIPRKLTVTGMINGIDGYEKSSTELPAPNDPFFDYVAFHAISITDSGDRVSSCFLLAASDHQPGTGPQDCDTKIGSTPVFWRQKYGPNRSGLEYVRVS